MCDRPIQRRCVAFMNFSGTAGPQLQRGLRRIDQRPALARVLLRQQPLVRNLDEVHVAEIFLAVGERQLDRFDAGVDVVGAVVPHRLEVVAFEDVQREQLGRALVRRRILVDAIAAIVDRDRRLDLGGVTRRSPRSGTARRCSSENFAIVSRDVALVEAIARGLQALRGGPCPRSAFPPRPASAACAPDRGCLKMSPGLRRLAVREVDLDAGRVLLQLPRALRSRAPSARRSGSRSRPVSIAGCSTCAKRHRAPAVEQHVPGVDDARHRARRAACRSPAACRRGSSGTTRSSPASARCLRR